MSSPDCSVLPCHDYSDRLFRLRMSYTGFIKVCFSELSVSFCLGRILFFFRAPWLLDFHQYNRICCFNPQ